MWRQIALPIIGLALCWLAVSGSTNFYLQWLDDSYQQVFDENISSIRAASQMQQNIWRLHAELIAQWDRKIDWSSEFASFKEQLETPLRTLDNKAITARERAAVEAISNSAD